RDKALGGQGRLGDTQQQAVVHSWQHALLLHLLVIRNHILELDLLALDEGGLTHFGDFHLAQHLANDHLDMLVVDLYTLEAVNLLDFIDHKLGQGVDPLQAQNIVGVVGTVGNHFAALNLLPLVYTELAPFGDQHFKVVATVRRGDDQAALALGFLAVGHGAGELGENRGILGLAGFEQVGNPRQTTGDIPGFGTLLGDPRNDVAGLDRLAVIEGDDGVRG